MATGGYAGYAPYAPGTWGSLVGLLLCVPLSWLSVPLYGLVLLASLGLSIWVASEAEHLFQTKDASPIVIDEIVGILVTYTAVPLTYGTVLLGFCCFRLFDILKPLPWLERLPGGWGIVLDDVLAGVLAHLCVWYFLLKN